jgi:hypothetical protein
MAVSLPAVTCFLILGNKLTWIETNVNGDEKAVTSNAFAVLLRKTGKTYRWLGTLQSHYREMAIICQK